MRTIFTAVVVVMLIAVVGTTGCRLTAPNPPAPPATDTPTPTPMPTATSTEAPTSLPPPVQERPGPDAALVKALEAHPDWSGRITYSSGDWTQVKAVIGPDGTSKEALALHWDSNVATYTIDTITALATPTRIEQPATKVIRPQGTTGGNRGNPARPRGGAITPQDTPGYDGNYPVTPGGENRRRGGDGNPATPRGGGAIAPQDTPGRD